MALDSCLKFLSYITGWTSAIAWQAVTCTTLYLAATMIQGLLIQSYNAYIPQRWHATLMGYVILAFSLYINTSLAMLLPKIESTILLLHVYGFFFTLIPLVFFGPHGNAKSVFFTFINGGNWPTQGLSFFIGLTTSMIAFVGEYLSEHETRMGLNRDPSGIDAATHMGMAVDMERIGVAIH